MATNPIHQKIQDRIKSLQKQMANISKHLEVPMEWSMMSGSQLEWIAYENPQEILMAERRLRRFADIYETAGIDLNRRYLSVVGNDSALGRSMSQVCQQLLREAIRYRAAAIRIYDFTRYHQFDQAQERQAMDTHLANLPLESDQDLHRRYGELPHFGPNEARSLSAQENRQMKQKANELKILIKKALELHKKICEQAKQQISTKRDVVFKGDDKTIKWYFDNWKTILQQLRDVNAIPLQQIESFVREYGSETVRDQIGLNWLENIYRRLWGYRNQRTDLSAQLERRLNELEGEWNRLNTAIGFQELRNRINPEINNFQRLLERGEQLMERPTQVLTNQYPWFLLNVHPLPLVRGQTTPPIQEIRNSYRNMWHLADTIESNRYRIRQMCDDVPGCILQRLEVDPRDQLAVSRHSIDELRTVPHRVENRLRRYLNIWWTFVETGVTLPDDGNDNLVEFGVTPFVPPMREEVYENVMIRPIDPAIQRAIAPAVAPGVDPAVAFRPRVATAVTSVPVPVGFYRQYFNRIVFPLSEEELPRHRYPYQTFKTRAPTDQRRAMDMDIVGRRSVSPHRHHYRGYDEEEEELSDLELDPIPYDGESPNDRESSQPGPSGEPKAKRLRPNDQEQSAPPALPLPPGTSSQQGSTEQRPSDDPFVKPTAPPIRRRRN